MTPHQTPQTSTGFSKALLILRWISLVIEIIAFGVYLYISLAYGESWIVTYAVVVVAICLDVLDIIALSLLHGLLLGLLELAVTAVFFFTLSILIPIGYPVYRPWLESGYVNAYATIALVVLHFVFAIACLVRGFGSLFQESSEISGERDPLLARQPSARAADVDEESVESDSS